MTYSVVTSGQIVSGTVLSNGDVQQITQAGSALATVISSGGEQDVFGARGVYGVASGTIVHDGGYIDISGGVATNLTISGGGSALLENNASATSVTVSGSGAVISGVTGAVISGISVAGGGAAYFSGLAVSGVSVLPGGQFTLASGSGTSVTVASSGLFIAEAAATSVTISSGGTASALGGGALTATVVQGGGNLWVGPGGNDNGTVISSGGTETVSAGQSTNPAVQGGGLLLAMSGGNVLGATINTSALAIASAGGTIGGTVSRGGELRISSGGFTVNAVVSSGTVNLLSGGVASTTQLWARGTLNVASGGSAVLAAGQFFGTINVASGGTAIQTFVQSSSVLNASAGSLLVSAGTMLNGTANVFGSSVDGKLFGGSFNVSSGGVASGTQVYNGTLNLRSGAIGSGTYFNGGGSEVVESGASETGATIVTGAQVVYGIATGTTMSGGAQIVYGSAVQDLVSGGTVTVSSGGLSVSGTILSAGAMTVYGEADDTLLSGGTVVVSSGGVSSDTTVTGGLLTVYGQAQGTVMSGGSAVIGSGGVTTGGTIDGGTEHVLAGGSSVQTVVDTGGYQVVDSGGSTVSAVLSGFAVQSMQGSGLATTIHSGATENVLGVDTGAHIDSFGQQVISNGGVTVSAMVYGSAAVTTGGLASGADVFSGGVVNVLAGGSAVQIDVQSAGSLTVAGGAATSVTAEAGASLLATSAGQFHQATVSSGATLVLSGGGVASGTTISGLEQVLGGQDVGGALYGVMSVGAAGVALSGTIYGGGRQLVLGSGVASGMVLSSGGVQSALQSGVTSGTMIRGGGSELVLSGGTAASTTVSAGGTLTVQSGGIATNVAMSSGGTLTNSGLVSATSGLGLSGTGGGIAVDNYGVIAGGVSIDGGTLTNYGTISGVSGTAIHFGGSGTNRLTVVSGSVIGGVVSATYSSDNTLELSNVGGGSALSNYSSDYIAFETLQVDGGGAWELIGTSMPHTVLNDGTIQIDSGDVMTISSAAGTGTYQVSGTGVLEFDGSSFANVVLGGSADALVLDDPGSFTGTISAFTREDTIRLPELTYSGSTAVLSGSTIVVSNTGSSYTLQLDAPITDSSLHLSADTNGKLVLTLAPLVTEALAADTGPSSVDGITSSATLTGIADPNGTVVLTSGASVLGSATADGSGDWSFTPTLADGTYTVEATQTDANSHTGSAVLTFTLDTAAPATPTIVLTSASDSAIVGDGITNVATPTLAGSGDDGTMVTLFDGGTPLGSATVVSGGWSITLADPLSDAAYTLTAIDSDEAGNVASATLNLTIDTAPPATPGIELDASTDSGIVGDYLTNATLPAIIGSDPEVGDLVELYDGNTLVGSSYIPVGGAYSITPTSPLADGPHSFTVVETDAAGNASAPASPIIVTIDTTADAAPTGLALLPSDDTGVQGDGLTSIDQPRLTGSGVAGDTVVIYEGATPIGSGTVDGDGTFTITPDSALADGAHVLYAIQTDPAGNDSPSSADATITIGNTTPDAPTPELDPADDSGVVGDGITNVAQPAIIGSGGVGDTVILYEGSTVLGSATVTSGGTFSITPAAALNDGVHILTLTETDQAANTSPESTPFDLTIDTTVDDPPTGLLLASASDSGVAGDDLTNVTTPAITGSGTAGDTVTLYDGGTAVGTGVVTSAGTFSVTPNSALPDGAHSFTVLQTDPAGNASSASTPLGVTIDTTLPAATSTPVLDPADDSGVAGDDATNVDQPAITGSGVAGDAITLYDGSTVIGTGLVGSDGTFSVVPTAPLSDGIHAITTTQTDAVGNESAPSTGLSLTIDTTPPTAPTPVLDAGSDSGASDTDRVTNVTTPVITGSGTAGDAIALYQGGTLLGSGTVGSAGTFSIALTTPLGTGVHALQATETDVAGNESGLSTPLSITIDTSADAAPTLLALATGSDSGVLGDLTTDATQPAITGRGVAGHTVTLYDGNAAVGTATVGSNGRFSVASSTGLSDGTHDFTVKQADPAGNLSPASSMLAVTIDTVADAAPTGLALDSGDDSGVTGDDLTDVTMPTITGSGLAGDTVTVYDGGTAIGTGVVDGGGSFAVVVDAPLTDGLHTLSATQTDEAGNESAASSPLALTIDTEAPAIPSPTLAAASDSGVLGDGITNVGQPAITGSGTPGDTITLYDGPAAVGTATVQGDGTFQVTRTAGPFADGVHSLRVTATDPAGNESAMSAPLALRVDTTADVAPSGPTLAPASDSGLSGDDLTSATTPFITGVGVAGHAVALYDGGTLVGSGTVGSNGRFSVAPSAALTDGAHVFTVQQTDLAGNVSASSQPLSVTVDTTADAAPTGLALDPATDSGPVGDLLTNVPQPLITGSGTAGDIVTLYDGGTAVGTAAVTSAGTFAVTPASTLADGAHVLTARLADAAGNVSDASTPLTVTVDTAVPSTPTLALDPGSDTGALGDGITSVVQPTITGSGDAADTVRLYDGNVLVGSGTVDGGGSFSIAVPTPLSNGTHSLTVTETDAAGNVSSRSVALPLLVDTVPDAAPSGLLLAPASDTGALGDDITSQTMPAINGTGVAGSTVTLYEGSTALGSAVVGLGGQFAVTPTSPLSSGSHSFTVRQTDPAGNVSAASAPLCITIDATVPDPTSTPTLDPASDSSGGFDDTNIDTPMLTGTGTAGDTVTLYDGVTAIGTATVAPAGTFAVSPSAPLADGVHGFTTTQTNTAGTESAASAPAPVTIDTVVPAAPTPSLAMASDSGTVGDLITNVAQPAITGAGEVGDTVTLYDGATAIGMAVVDGSGAFSIVPTASLADGVHTLTVTETDLADNTSAPSSPLPLTIDTAAPTPPTLMEMAAATDPAKPELTGTAATGDTVSLYQNNGLVGTAVASAGVWQFNYASALAAGDYTLTATSTDTAGNVSPDSAPLTVHVNADQSYAITLPATGGGTKSYIYDGSGVLSTVNTYNAATLLLTSVNDTQAVIEIRDTDGLLIGTITQPSTSAFSLPVFDTTPQVQAASTGSGPIGSVVDLLSETHDFVAQGNDIVTVHTGDATIIATGPTTTVNDIAANLTFFGNGGISTVHGGAGTVVAVGGTGGGVLVGGTAGHNVLVAGGGTTQLVAAGDGDALFGSDTGTDTLYGVAGSVALIAGAGNETLNAASGNVAFGGAGFSTLFGGSAGGSTLLGGSGTSVLIAQGGPETLWAGSGHSTLWGGAGPDVLGGNSSIDSVTLMVGGGGGDLFLGGGGTTTAAGGSGNDVFFTGSGAMTITEGAGNDVAVFGSGNANVTGGSGTDLYMLIAGQVGGTDVIQGFKVGVDRIDLFGYSAADTQTQVAGGNTTFTLADHTSLTLVGVTRLAPGSLAYG